MNEISRRDLLKGAAVIGAAAATGAAARPRSAAAAVPAASVKPAVSVTSRWVGPVFQQIDYGLNGYTGRPLTTASNGSYAHHSDFPGGGTPQTQQSLPCKWEPFTDYFQIPAPWPPVMGIMNNVNTTGPGVTGQSNNLAALYLGTGAGMSSNNDSHGKPMNYEAMAVPSSLAGLPVPAGTWTLPTMANGSAALPLIPVIGWNLGGASLDDIVNGVYDAGTIIPAAQACKNWAADANGNPAYPGQPGGQVLIRLMHEFNGPWAPYCPGSSSQPSDCTAATFVAAWKHIVNVFAAQGATNARWVWAPNICASGAAGTTHSGWKVTSGTTAACYPGDAYVDYVGLDGYNKSVPNWTKFQTLFSPSYGWMYNGDAYTNGPITTANPMIITEVGSLEDDNFTSPPQTKAQFISDIGTVVPASFPNVEGVMWWHEDVGDSLEWPVTSSAAAASAWNALARSSAFNGKPALIQGVTAALAGGGTGPGTPYIVADYANSSAGSSFTLPVNRKAMAAGDSLVIVVEASNPGITVASVTDTKGNAYTVDNASHTAKGVSFAYKVSAAALTLLDSITVNYSSSNTNCRVIALGLPGVTAVDRTPAGNGGSGSSFSAATGTLGSQNEVCVGAVGYSGSTNASGLSWTLIENLSTFPVLTAAYKLPGATTTSQTFSGTLPAGTLFDAGVITFR